MTTYLKTAEVAAYYGVDPKTVLRWARDGRFPYPVGRAPSGRWRFAKQDVLADVIADYLEVER